MSIFGFNKKQEYSANEILKQLDQCANNFTFPMLDNGYIYTVTSKISTYRDEKRWVIIIEVVGLIRHVFDEFILHLFRQFSSIYDDRLHKSLFIPQGYRFSFSSFNGK